MTFGRGVFRNLRGFTGVAKISAAILFSIVAATLFVQLIWPAIASSAAIASNSTIDISTNSTSYGRQFNISINNTGLANQSGNITRVNITFDNSVFSFVPGSNMTSNSSAIFNDTSVVGNLTWYTGNPGGFALAGTNVSLAFNFTVINRTHTERTITITWIYDNGSMESRAQTITVRDDVVPVINVTGPPSGEFTNTPSAVIFTANLTEDNPGILHGEYANVTNATLSVRRKGFGTPHRQVNMTCFYGSSLRPNWFCNATVDLTASPLSVQDGDVVGFWFNSTDLQGNIGVNATPDTNFTLTVDTTLPMVKDAIKNSTADLKSTSRINLSVTVTDINRNDSHVKVSGNSGGTNLTINLTANNAFNGSLRPTDVGCPTNTYCTFTFFGVDSAENANTTTIVALIDDDAPNVTAPVANDTDRIVTGGQVFRINVTVLEKFNMSNVTFGGGIELGGTNQSNGSWLITSTADSLGCSTIDDGVCTIRINASDRAGNYNGSVYINITVDDIRPNVTLSSPLAGNSTTTSAVSFNVTVDENNPSNASLAVVQITPLGQGATNFSLLNNTVNGIWTFKNSSMPDGIYTAQFFISDAVNNQNNSVTVTFAVDTVLPAVTNAVVNDTIVRGDQIINVRVNVSDTNRDDTRVNVSGRFINDTSGLNLSLSFNSSLSLAVAGTNIFGTNSTFTALSAGCRVGSNMGCSLLFSAADAAGNTNNSVYINITVDDSSPNVTITSPANVTTGTTVNFNVSVQEQNPANESIAVVQITPLSAGQTAANYSLTNYSGVWGFTNLSIPNGVYNARFFIYDAANNVNNGQSVTFTVDTVSPVINSTSPSSNGTVSNPNAVLFRAKVVELNLNKTNNITVFYKRQGAASYSSNTTVCYADPDSGPSPPHYVCNITVNVEGIAGISTGDVMEFFFNMTDSQRQLNSATNGTAAAPISASVDNGNPSVTNPIVNKTGVDFQPTFRFNVSITVTDSGSGVSSVYVSGNIGATNVSMQSTGSNNYNVSTRPTDLGCVTNGVCTLRFYANDTAGNINGSITTTIFVDSSSPNVTNATTNVTVFAGTSPLVRGSQLIRINVTVLENFNISNVTFGNGTRIGGINNTDGNWSIRNVSAINFGCGDVSGILNNCRITITATDNATNSNSSVFIDITVDDFAPNVTLQSPTSTNISATVVNFNVTVLEPNPNYGVLQLTQGSVNNNYTLTNRSGNWGFTNTSIGEGVYIVTFYINDSAGNLNASVATTISIDTTAPTVLSVLTNTSVDKVSTAMFNLTSIVTDTNRVDSNVNASGNTGATNVSLTLKEANNFTAETNGSALGCPTAGVCTIRVYARDAAGNIASSTTTMVIDDVRPNVTTPYTNITIFSGNSSNSSRTPLVKSATVFRTNATVLENFNISSVTFGNATTQAGTNATNGNWSRDASAADYGCAIRDGISNNCRIYVTATDNATNSNSSVFVEITVDDAVPNVTISSPGNTTFSTTRTVNFNATVLEPNPGSGVVELTPLNPSGAVQNFSLTNYSGNWGYTNLSVPEGVYRARFFINDSVGNLNLTQTVVFTITLDVGAPNITITSPSNTTIITTRTINFNATVLENNPGSGVVQVRNISVIAGQGPQNYTLTNYSGNWGYTNLSMPDGVWEARFFINDSQGNMNNTESVVFTLSLDSTNPTGSLVSVTNNATYLGTAYVRQNISVNFTISDSSPLSSLLLMFRNSSGNFSVVSNYTNTTFSVNTTLLSDGNYTLVINATDSAGNSNGSIARQNITIDNTQPNLTSWNYNLRTRVVSLTFSEKVDSTNIRITNITVKHQDRSRSEQLTVAGTTTTSVNSSQVNITLLADHYEDIEGWDSFVWNIDILEATLQDIVGNIVYNKTYLNVSTRYNITTRLSAGTWSTLTLQPEDVLESYDSLNSNFTVASVLRSIDNLYSLVYYNNGTLSASSAWLSYNGSRPVNSLTHMNNSNALPYHIKKTQDTSMWFYIE
ncbi:MAG: hypothetical protein HY518_05910 [Candidatus Aenigmarchaeota archaeon]|nr:hypothetical protein [Candidatus Aenigmarchaeota archaeon]